MNLWDDSVVYPQENVDLSPYTTWRIGGEARWFAEPENSEQLKSLLKSAEREGIRIYIMGGGSNILINDSFLDGLVIRIKADNFADVAVDENSAVMTLGGGCTLAKAMKIAMDYGLGGLEGFAGIPGTIGGAIAMNAGGKEGIGNLVRDICYMDFSGQCGVLESSLINFSYRKSCLTNMVITEAVLQLEKSDSEAILLNIKKYLEEKRFKQPLDVPSAGCVFKNPEGKSAGYLIDTAGCKGMTMGGAEVSCVHANFFVNHGNATCTDMLNLIEMVRCAVLKEHNIELELEVKLWL
jgi:UDP-N-acetylmuramate dehydrogenase